MNSVMRRPVRLAGLLIVGVLAGWAALACQNTGTQSGGLFSGGIAARGERWTIRGARVEAPNHREIAGALADQLRKVSGLNASKVRVVSGPSFSVIYYGEYQKVAKPDGSYAFPEDYKREIEWIRSLSYQGQTPFFFAGPELISTGEASSPSGAEGSSDTARGTHSLQIAVFFNTPDFNQRKEAAEAYVADLRTRGYPAFYYHETLRSFVFVGEFDKSDVIWNQEEGRPVYGPRVEQFIARNPEEFQYLTENGMKKKIHLAPDQAITNPSILVPIPGRAASPEGPTQPQRLPGEGRY